MAQPRRHLTRLAALTALAGATLSATGAGLSFEPALAKSPPKVKQATMELLAKPNTAGNAILRVQFADLKRQAPLPIQGPAGPVPLRDDGVAPDAKAGDGIFSAYVQVDAAAYGKEQQRRIALSKQYPTLPRFEMRELLGFMPFVPSPDVTPKPGVATVLDDFPGVPHTVDPERSLMIRHPAVVDDPARTFDPCSGTGTPMGAWTFGRLMTEMANQPATGIDPSDFVQNWMSQWLDDQTINTHVAPMRYRGARREIDQWPRLSNGKLDLARAPFRLLAIVNRQDLRGNLAYGGGGAGEARLVFGLLHCRALPGEPWALAQQVQQMTVIFEYGVPRSGCVAVRDWATQWKDLGALVLGSPAYNAALQAITDQFTLRNASPGKPHRSAINQVRTDDIALADTPADTMWELRESRLDPNSLGIAQLRHMTTAQTPAFAFKSTLAPVLRDFINANAGRVMAGTHQVPLTDAASGGTPMLGGNAFSGTGGGLWNPTGVLDLEVRHRFSKATCDGCHRAETETAFTHVKPRAAGVASDLSDFVTGANMPKRDPVSGVNRSFNELLDRQAKLDFTANLTCTSPFDMGPAELFFVPQPVSFGH